VTVRLGRRAVSSQLDLDLAGGTLTPLLLAIRDGALTTYAGNERVNLGLQLVAGRYTNAPDVTFTDQNGRSHPFSGFRGRLTIVAAFETHCHESCPLYTAVLSDLQTRLRARGWQDRVNLVEITMDPDRDTPPVLAAYARMVGATWELLTADPDSLRIFWSALGAAYRTVPYQGPAPTD